MTVGAVANNYMFYKEAARELSEIAAKINSLIILSEIFIAIALFFNPFLVPLIVSQAYLDTVFTSINFISSAVFLITMFFLDKLELEYNELELEVDQKKDLLLNEKSASDLKIELPIGLTNGSPTLNSALNCWINSFFQFIMNIPRYRESLKNCPDDIYGVTLGNLIEKYQAEQKSNSCSVSTIESGYIRILAQKFNKAIPESGEADVFECFNSFSDYLPKFNTRIETYCSYDNLPRPSSIFEENERQRRVEMLEGNKFKVSYIQKENSLSLHQPTDATTSLLELLNDFFERENREVKNPDDKINMPSSTNEVIKYPIDSSQTQLVSAPDDLCLLIKRFSIDQEKHIEKKAQDIEVPFRLSLEKDRHVLNERGEYELDSFIVHIGSTPSSGHYIAYVCKEGLWFECNDDKITRISETTALEKAKQAYFIHYSKLPSD